jgi:DNA-binding transcriptional LysR family regulator
MAREPGQAINVRTGVEHPRTTPVEGAPSAHQSPWGEGKGASTGARLQPTPLCNDERVIPYHAEGPTLREALAAGDPSWGMWSLRACRAFSGLDSKIAIEVTDITTCLELVQHGVGASIGHVSRVNSPTYG